MLAILQTMRAARADGFPFVALADVHPRTLRAMQAYDWIVASSGFDGTRYVITGRGLKALAVYEQPTLRFDGMCPSCGARPKAVSKNGKQSGYCHACARRHSRRQYRMKGYQADASQLCSACGARPRVVYSNGAIVYCADCRRQRRKQEREARRQRRLTAIASGSAPTCCVKGCEASVHHTQHSVYDYCYSHYRERQRIWRQARAVTP